MQRIAFFGIGAMGAPMVKNLLRAGYSVCTRPYCERDEKTVDELRAFGDIHTGASNAETVRGCDVVFTSLPADSEVKAVLMDESFADALKDGAILVDMTSCTTETIQAVNAWYAGRNATLLDAPVSGGISGAANGTLTIFASGNADAIKAVRPILGVLGKNIFELGPCGEGKTFKNLNNMLLAVNLLAATEAFHIAKKQGIDLEKFYDVICVSSGGSKALHDRWKRMIEENYDGGFRVSLARKDLANALRLAGPVPTPLAQLTYQLMLANARNDMLDLAAMSELFNGD